MKKAKVEIVSIAATCPDCGETLYDPESGSAYISVNQYGTHHQFKCDGCGGSYQLEAKAWK